MCQWSLGCLSIILILHCGALARSQQQRRVMLFPPTQSCYFAPWKYLQLLCNRKLRSGMFGLVYLQASKHDPSNRLTAGAMHAGRRSSDVGERASFPAATEVSVHPSQSQDEKARGVCLPEHLLTQSGQLPGEWVLHEDPQWQSYYGSQSACPRFAQDFDCLAGDGPQEYRNHDLARVEFRKIFRPHRCRNTRTLGQHN